MTDRKIPDREHFLSSSYRTHIQSVHDREQDRCYYLFFHRDGQDIGFAMPAIYTTEDGKCFLVEYCVFPEYRGNGTGKKCAGVLLSDRLLRTPVMKGCIRLLDLIPGWALPSHI